MFIPGRIGLGRWSRWLPIRFFVRWGVRVVVVALFVALAAESRADVQCGEWTGESYSYRYWTSGNCSGNAQTIGACDVIIGKRYDPEALPEAVRADFPTSWQHIQPQYGSCSLTQWTATYSAQYNCQGTSSIQFTAFLTAAHSGTDSTGDAPPWWEDECGWECPVGQGYAPRSLPAGSSGNYCYQVGGPGEGCSVNLSLQSGWNDPATSTAMGRYYVEGTGEMCTAGAEAPHAGSLAASQNVTCITMAGQQHCWHKNDVNCQYVNGERWCTDDVRLQPITTAQQQVLEMQGANSVVDDNGTAVTPSSQVTVPTTAAGGEGGGTSTVNHYNTEVVVNNNSSSGGHAGNPAQSGSGIPGAGASGDGGPGDGSGSGDGDGDGDGDGEEVGDIGGDLESFCPEDADCGLGNYLDGFYGTEWWGVIDSLTQVGGGSAASCPVFSFNWLGTPVSTELHCVVAEDIRPLLSLVFLFGWSVLGFRVVFSA